MNSSEHIEQQHKQTCKVTRHASLSEWFWFLVEQVVEQRGCCVSEDFSREIAILRQLEARRFTAAEAALAEHHILFGQWSAEKLLRVGLELSDFYPEVLTVTRSEWESLRRRLYRALQIQVQEEIQWAETQRNDADTNGERSEPCKQTLRELNRQLKQAKERVSIAMSSAKTLHRNLQNTERRETLLQAKLFTANELIVRLQRSLAEQTADHTGPEPEIPGQLSLFPEYEPSEEGEFWDIFEEEVNPDSALPPL